MKISRRHLAYTIACNIIIINSTIWCMQKKEEELQISTEQIKEEIGVTASLSEAAAKYTDLHKRICNIFSGFNFEEERNEVLHDLEKYYGNHLLHKKLPTKNNTLLISGSEIINTYQIQIQNLDFVIETTTPSQSPSSLPSIFGKNFSLDFSPQKQLTLSQLLELFTQAKKALQRYEPYHQELVQNSDLHIGLEQLRNNVIDRYHKAMSCSGLMLEEWESEEKPTCPYLLINMINNKPLYEIKFEKFAIKQQQKLTLYRKKINKNLDQNELLAEKLQKSWNKEKKTYTQKYTKELLNNFFPLLKQLNKIRQFAQAIQFNAEDGGAVGLKLNQSNNHQKRLQNLCSNLLSFTYPYMTQKEIKLALQAPYQPNDPCIPGFIDKYARKLDEQEATIYLTIRDKTMQEVFKALDIFNRYKSKTTSV